MVATKPAARVLSVISSALVEGDDSAGGDSGWKGGRGESPPGAFQSSETGSASTWGALLTVEAVATPAVAGVQ